jgi:signal transduction histidine kinase/DNA-binding response OmpR family regulator
MKKIQGYLNLNRIFLLPYVLLFLLYNCSCKGDKTEKTFRVGFSQCATDVWRKTMLDEMRRELSFHPEVDFRLREANSNSSLQVKQIQELVDERIDLLIVSPNEAEPLTPIIDKVYKEGLPVIVVDRSTISKNYTAFIGASNYKVGTNAGAYTNAILKGKGNVLEINGVPVGSSADIGRHDGFVDFLKQYSGIVCKPRYIADTETSEWEKIFEAFLIKNNDIDLIYAHDDRIAFSVANILKKMGLDQRIKIIGIDGLPGKDGGIELVEKGILKATILYPTGGKEAIQTAVDILEKKAYKKENELASSVIDSTNVKMMRLQNEKLAALQSDIDRGQQKIEEQTLITRNQSTIIYIISISLALALILGSVLFYYLKENRKINARLALQNEQILTQRDQLIELAKQAKEATDAKINFFTNISHEFRTPLTLILGPLEEMLNNPKLHYTTKQYLELIQKNTIRLLRLVNELIDFRKIEVNKMQLQASENDLVQFTSEIIEPFKALAAKRNIDLRIISKQRNIPLWFDNAMLDKVMFNLLSNAFKFTSDNGFIHITLEKNETGNIAVIKVEDNGIGMAQDIAEHAFELFYHAGITNQQGSGLGLSLSKELINLHHGNIKVSSKQWKGTCFEIQLPLGKMHLEPEEIVKEKSTGDVMYYDERIYATELDKTETAKEENKSTESSTDRMVLVIEDNPDLRNFLVEKLQANYQVLTADNGVSGLQQAFDNIPDLIISDIIMPGKDGIAVTNTLKTDFKTSHIPVILLTAKTEVEEQIEGMKNMADAYLLKPFNLQFLEETIKSVMKNREILREHYTSEILTETKTQTPKKLDRKFINEFTAIVESNLSNDQFSVEDICKQIGISRVQLYRKVKALLDCNVNDYILNVRLQKAKHYLAQGELSVAEIAYKVGFASPGYFSTVFKNKFGATPKEFKEK